MSKQIVAALMLYAAVLPLSHAAIQHKPCDCDDLTVIESEIIEQQYMHDLFAQWEGHRPKGPTTPGELKTLADLKFNLAFYGVPSEAPRPPAKGGGAAFGTDLTPGKGCPIVEYLFDRNNKPLMVADPPLRKGEKRRPIDLIHATRPISEDTYKSKQCAAMVHYIFEHERQHQNTCNDLQRQGKDDTWQSIPFFIKDDKAAYAKGLEVLKAQRDQLRGRCEDRNCDGQWHGTLVWSKTFSEKRRDSIPKGADMAYPNGEGWREYGHRKSARMSVRFTTPALAGAVNAKYQGWQSDVWYDKGQFVMANECGWYKKTTWILDNGAEATTQAQASGSIAANIYSDDRTVRVSLQTKAFAGSYAKREWNKPQGYCQQKNNEPFDRTTALETTMDAVSIQISGTIDPEHPDEITLTRIQPDADGKGETAYTLKLRRCSGKNKGQNKGKKR